MTDTFHAMKQAQRAALASKDLTNQEMASIEASEIPLEHRYSAAGPGDLTGPSPRGISSRRCRSSEGTSQDLLAGVAPPI